MIPPLAALFAFPLLALILFNALSFRLALIWTILLGHLFLPTRVAWDLPLLPAISKDSMPALSALLFALVFASQASRKEGFNILRGWIPRHILITGFLLLLVAGAFMTVVTNQEVLRFGPVTLPALRFYDAFSIVLSTIIFLLPLLLARKYLASEDSHAMILKCFAIAGAIYAFPIIYELVMSPQLNNMIYGFFPHSWRQHIRGSGYRPIVFMQHGLVLGIFMCCAALSALALFRNASGLEKSRYMMIGGWLCLILLASNTLGAVMILVALAPVVLFLPQRLQLISAAVIAGSALIYPTLRGADAVPVDRVVSIAERIDTERAKSMQYRLNNEDLLLARANEKSLFGWGGYGRSRIFNERGRDISTTDGQWVIQIGERGWAGYIGQFGLLCLPILLFAFRARIYQVGPATLGLAIVLAANLVDLIPNAGLTPVTWLLAGALIGRLEQRAPESQPTDTQSIPTGPQMPQYSRFTPRPTAAPATPRASLEVKNRRNVV